MKNIKNIPKNIFRLVKKNGKKLKDKNVVRATSMCALGCMHVCDGLHVPKVSSTSTSRFRL